MRAFQTGAATAELARFFSPLLGPTLRTVVLEACTRPALQACAITEEKLEHGCFRAWDDARAGTRTSRKPAQRRAEGSALTRRSPHEHARLLAMRPL